MATTMGQEAADFVRVCESIHFLIWQGTLKPNDLLDKLKLHR